VRRKIVGETDILQRKNRRGTGILEGKIEGEIGTLERERTGILERENRGRRIHEGGYRQGDTHTAYMKYTVQRRNTIHSKKNLLALIRMAIKNAAGSHI
jgi:hypothetical protein